MSPISSTQQGIIAQQEFAKLVVLGSAGRLEVAWSLTDDERRDVEVHAQGQFGRGLAFQIKSTTYLEHRFRARHLAIHFAVRKARLTDHPLFWYFFAYLDLGTMAFAQPVFLVPSSEVHAHAAPHARGDTWTFNFTASLAPTTRDRWRRRRAEPAEVGKRVLQILARHRVRKTSLGLGAPFAFPESALWVSRR